ncbi:DUF1513 domain-containing protein [Sulfitobacter sp. F26204]|uniref:DUF1513 domain-containing protein n=1 Tax=Sulfitobacter sp. F26204 TaxID=2996014 RepID=UPI00225DE3A3|nr:DUF1513 domain-containing protein [Sulfitobacter sp. F26204]MCX7561438.1 DUF1513 domain-containing protein [Sulfitobacter sp. F26204]
MADRRTFLAGMIASALMPKPLWADVGRPAFLSAGRTPLGAYALCGLTVTGEIVFEIPLPSRGHAAAAHPVRPEAIAFARRPGTFAVVIDCRTGREKVRLTSPPGRHFYGHGVFSADGALLFTTENDFDAARGMIGVWDANDGYARVDEFPSGGIGPHDIKRLPDQEKLVVANGGIETHPDTGRTKLNIPTMRSNLTYIDFNGQIEMQSTLDRAHQRNSIRHLAVAPDGSVAFAMQWQGDLSKDLPLLGVADPEGRDVTFLSAPSIARMQGYLGSLAISPDGYRVATTSPRSNLMLIVARDRDSVVEDVQLTDICGVAATETGFFYTTGTGQATTLGRGSKMHAIAWDNHLVAI